LQTLTVFNGDPPTRSILNKVALNIYLIFDDQSMRFRTLYLDGARAAMDTQSVELPSSEGGLYIGAGSNLETGAFFSGLIDDVRIYNVALTPEQIEIVE